MKRIITLLAIIVLSHFSAFSQDKYEMVIEKKDGSEIVINVEDIERVYFRKTTGNTETDYDKLLFGKWIMRKDLTGETYTDTNAFYVYFREDHSYEGFPKNNPFGFSDIGTWTIEYPYFILNNSSYFTFYIETLTSTTFIVSLGQNSFVLEKAGGIDEGGNGYISCPDANHPHMIDLGLPSGTKWACCNVGATMPEGYGNYYAWGETQPKSTYNWNTYQYGNSGADVVNIGSNIAGTSYDAATANWGSPWRMPTVSQISELINNCSNTWTTQNGVNGRRFTGTNGGTIFLPAAGYHSDDNSYDLEK